MGGTRRCVFLTNRLCYDDYDCYEIKGVTRDPTYEIKGVPRVQGKGLTQTHL
jgi:hypothetical protein